MSLAPLLNAAPAIQVHAFAAMAAFALGVVQFAAPKGTLPHRTLGWIWVALMVVISGSIVPDPRDPAAWTLEPDPPAVGVCAHHAGDRRAGGPQASRTRPPDHDDLDFRRRAAIGRLVHFGAGQAYAHGPVRVLAEVPDEVRFVTPAEGPGRHVSP